MRKQSAKAAGQIFEKWKGTLETHEKTAFGLIGKEVQTMFLPLQQARELIRQRPARGWQYQARLKGFRRDRGIILEIELRQSLNMDQVTALFFHGMVHGRRKAQERLLTADRHKTWLSKKSC